MTLDISVVGLQTRFFSEIRGLIEVEFHIEIAIGLDNLNMTTVYGTWPK